MANVNGQDNTAFRVFMATVTNDQAKQHTIESVKSAIIDPASGSLNAKRDAKNSLDALAEAASAMVSMENKLHDRSGSQKGIRGLFNRVLGWIRKRKYKSSMKKLERKFKALMHKLNGLNADGSRQFKDIMRGAYEATNSQADAAFVKGLLDETNHQKPNIDDSHVQQDSRMESDRTENTEEPKEERTIEEDEKTEISKGPKEERAIEEDAKAEISKEPNKTEGREEAALDKNTSVFDQHEREDVVEGPPKDIPKEKDTKETHGKGAAQKAVKSSWTTSTEFSARPEEMSRRSHREHEKALKKAHQEKFSHNKEMFERGKVGQEVRSRSPVTVPTKQGEGINIKERKRLIEEKEQQKDIPKHKVDIEIPAGKVESGRNKIQPEVFEAKKPSLNIPSGIVGNKTSAFLATKDQTNIREKAGVKIEGLDQGDVKSRTDIFEGSSKGKPVAKPRSKKNKTSKLDITAREAALKESGNKVSKQTKDRNVHSVSINALKDQFETKK